MAQHTYKTAGISGTLSWGGSPVDIRRFGYNTQLATQKATNSGSAPYGLVSDGEKTASGSFEVCMKTDAVLAIAIGDHAAIDARNGAGRKFSSSDIKITGVASECDIAGETTLRITWESNGAFTEGSAA